MCKEHELARLRDFAWSRVMRWEGFGNPTEVAAHTDLIKIWQKLQEMVPDNGDTRERDRRAEAALAPGGEQPERCDAVTVIDCARFENFELKDFCGAHQVFDSQGIERWGKFPAAEGKQA